MGEVIQFPEYVGDVYSVCTDDAYGKRTIHKITVDRDLADETAKVMAESDDLPVDVELVYVLKGRAHITDSQEA
jgi:hypothetical protein